MRRYTFYLSIALLAFVVGSLIIFKFYFVRVEQVVVGQTIEKRALENNERDLVQPTSQGNDDAIDEDEGAFKVLEPTIKKWLRGEKIIEGWNDISSEMVKELTGKNESELSEGELHFWKDSGFRFAIYLTDVDGDGKNELVARNYCAPVGNCEFWLFQKNGNSYKKLLKADMVQRFSLKKSKSNGYFDIETTSHGSAASGGIAIYKFDGKEYKIDKCFEYLYEAETQKNGESLYSKDGQIVIKDKRTLTPIKCENR